jgi:hypothetical protein
MIIADKYRLREIKEAFHRLFPHLKLEFYRGSHLDGEGSPGREQLDVELTIAQLSGRHEIADFHIRPDMTVGSFERDFFGQFGINVQVFRKSGNLWMQTTATDSWTLAEQNRKGGASAEAYREKTNLENEEVI